MLPLEVDTTILAHCRGYRKLSFANRLRVIGQLLKVRVAASVFAATTGHLPSTVHLPRLIDQALYTEDWAVERADPYLARQARRARRALERFIPDEGCCYE